jgi:glycosyltransferase involved in cell wall biosynthesis
MRRFTDLVRRRPALDGRPSGDLVFAGPLPPAPTGIATYDRAVLDGLGRIGFTDRHRLDVAWPIEARHAPRFPGYRLGIFQLGNNVEFHLEIYRAAFLPPALVVLHDLALDDFVNGLRTAGEPLGFMAAREAELLRGRLTSTDVVRNEPLRVPWCAHVVRRARGVIVHSDFARRYLEEMGCRTPVFVVPHPVVGSAVDVARAGDRARVLRAPLEAAGASTVVVAPGDLNEAKQLGALLTAAERLDPSVHVVLAGRRITGYDVDRIVEEADLGDRVALAADLSDEDFAGWIAAADVVVDLRYPHRGEVSGSLARTMQIGRPAIVSATGTYLEVPDAAVLRVAPGPTDPVELAARIAQLADDPGRRTRMGEAARAHVEALRASDATARGYEAAVEATLALIADPAHKAMQIWGRALADLDLDEADLARGYGLGYVRAMEEFRPAS